jgi:hypothetical protein
MNWFWHAIWIALVVIPVTILWLSCVFDIFRRDDLGVASRVLWLLGVLVLPIFGSLLYLITRPHPAAAYEAPARQDGSLTQQLSDLDRLRRSGAIDDREFQIAKADAIAQVPAPRGAAADAAAGSTSGTGART